MPRTPGSGTGAPPINILIGRPGDAAADDVTKLIDLDTVSIEETGNQSGASFDAVLSDLGRAPRAANAFSSMRGEWRLQVNWKNPTSGDWKPMFNGFIRAPSPEIAAIYGSFALHAEDMGTLLDRAVIGTQGVSRAAGESDKQRIAWLFGGLDQRDGIKVAQPLLAEGLDYATKVQTLNASMPAQRFSPRLTLRQALERILSQASDSADYFLDHRLRLWTFDSDTAAAVLDVSPYDIDVTATPGAGKVAPQDLVVEWDSDGLWTGFYATGSNARVSRTYLDSSDFAETTAGRLPSPYGTQLYGRRIGNFHAPDADTDVKVQRAVRAALRDTRNPVPRITWTVEGASCLSDGVKAGTTTGDRWRGGQSVYVKSAVHGLNGSGTDAGPWAGSNGTGGALLQPFRLKRVRTTFASGKGDMIQECEAGGRRKALYQGSA